jgi:hypothetical protein
LAGAVEVGGPAVEEAGAAGDEESHVGLGPGLVGAQAFEPDRPRHRLAGGDVVAEWPLEDDEDVAPGVARHCRRDRAERRLAHREDDDRRCVERPDRHPQPGAAEVEAGDDRDRDRGDDQRQKPSGNALFEAP